MVQSSGGEYKMWFLEPDMTFESLIARILAMLVIIFLVFPFHEFAHAWTAHKLGDDTAKHLGKLTLNPLEHFSTIGAVSLLLFNFGWANPVPSDPRNFKNPRVGMALTALAGPFANLIVAFIAGFALNFAPFCGAASPWMSMFIYYFISINITLVVFNLIPLYSLDGARILVAILPDSLVGKYYQNIRTISWVILILLLFGLFSFPLGFLERILYNFIIKATRIPIRF